MKKIFVVFLTAVICFGLISCKSGTTPNTDDSNGTQQSEPSSVDRVESETNDQSSKLPETETENKNEIIITTENWQDYLEVKIVEEWGVNGCYLSYVLALKDIYADKTINSTTTLDIEWSGTWVYKEFTCDRDEKIYKIGEVIADKPSENITKQSCFLTQLSTIEHYANVQSVILLGGETDYYTYVKVIENLNVLNASGTIILR